MSGVKRCPTCFSAVQSFSYREDYYLFFRNKIDDFVWKSFDDVFSCPLYSTGWISGLSLDKVDSRVNLQETVISQAYPGVLIPGKYLL